jgi:hypothetical protein
MSRVIGLTVRMQEMRFGYSEKCQRNGMDASHFKGWVSSALCEGSGPSVPTASKCPRWKVFSLHRQAEGPT